MKLRMPALHEVVSLLERFKDEGSTKIMEQGEGRKCLVHDILMDMGVVPHRQRIEVRKTSVTLYETEEKHDRRPEMIGTTTLPIFLAKLVEWFDNNDHYEDVEAGQVYREAYTEVLHWVEPGEEEPIFSEEMFNHKVNKKQDSVAICSTVT